MPDGPLDLLREWALLAVRNVTCGNFENQRAIAALRPKQVVETDEMRRLGIKAEVDEHGKVRVTKTEAAAAVTAAATAASAKDAAEPPPPPSNR